jgi:hypothetical protein
VLVKPSCRLERQSGTESQNRILTGFVRIAEKLGISLVIRNFLTTE